MYADSGSVDYCQSGALAPATNPEVDQSTAPVKLTMTPFTVNPGQELYYCQTFANPWGKAVNVKTYSLKMGVGSHHMFAFYVANATNGALAACPMGGFQQGPFTFSAQTPTAELDFPPTVGATIPAGSGFQLMVHYLNTTAAALQSSVELTMYIAKPNVVTNPAGALFLDQISMSVPATGCSTSPGCVSSRTYTLPQDVNVIIADGHMHRYGTNFTATTNTGVTLFSTTQWDDHPAKCYYPALHLPSGTSITWSCSDVNTTGQILTFGESALTNVMCISSNIFFPVLQQNISNPVITSNQ